MFEDAMMESGGRINTRSRYYTVFGALFNGALLAGMVLMPLLYPEALPKNATAAMLVAPPPPPPPPPPPAPQPLHMVRVTPALNEFNAPPRIPTQISMGRDTAQPPATNLGPEGSGPASAPSGLNDIFGGATQPVVKAAVPNKIIVSQGVMAGSILSRPEPAYPAIAKAARIQGTVILSATISRAGTIENLTVVSGPAMLTQAAIDAVRNWRYRPYLLNGQPVEVQTLVNVTFTLGG